MNKKFINYIIKRYLRFDKEHPFIYISFLLAFLGILTGVATLMIAMGIMNGMDKEFEKKLKVMNYPLTIYSAFREIDKEFLTSLEKKFPDFKFSPYLQTSAVLKSGNEMKGILLYGVDFNKEQEVNEVIKQYLPNRKIGIFDVIVGKNIYESLTSNKVIIIFSTLSPMGFGVAPILKKVNVIGYFKSGLIAYDKSIAYMNIKGLQKILHKKGFDGIHIWCKDPFKAIKEVQKILPPGYGVIGWWEQNGNFFAALKMEKRALFLVLMLIIIVASLNIISSLLMMVMSRRKEIALMLSLGASKKEIKYIFLKLGTIIGVAGIVSGSLVGWLGIWVLKTFDIIKLPVDVYGVSKLPVDLSLIDYLIIIVGAFIIVLLSSFYPAKKASQTDVLKVLRYE